jgi:hypothetical protein
MNAHSLKVINPIELFEYTRKIEKKLSIPISKYLYPRPILPVNNVSTAKINKSDIESAALIGDGCEMTDINTPLNVPSAKKTCNIFNTLFAIVEHILVYFYQEGFILLPISVLFPNFGNLT